MRGILLAGGNGTRLLPATRVINKHLIPILNRPMIEYPIETLKAMGCTDILIVSGGNHIGAFAEYLGDGKTFGVSLTYRVQSEAGGIAQALALAEGFAGGKRVAVILGDNVFDNHVIQQIAKDINAQWTPEAAHVFLKTVLDPQRFGVASFDGQKWTIEEKPKEPKSDKAVTGLYVYPPDVFDVIRKLRPSARGELEITDVNNWYIEKGNLIATDLGYSFWSDAGTPHSLYEVTKWAYEQGR